MIKLLICGQLARDKTPEAAFAHMRDVHGPLVYDPPADAGPMPATYAQNHGFADESLGAWASPRQFVTEIGFEDVAHLKAATSTPYYLEKLRPDELNFVDQTGVRAVVMQPQPRHGELADGAVRLFIFLKRREPRVPEDLSAACDAAFVACSVDATVAARETGAALAPPPGQTAFADRVEILSFLDRGQATAFARARLATFRDHLAPVLDLGASFALLTDAYPVDRLRRTRSAP